MSDVQRSAAEPVSSAWRTGVIEDFARSELFERTFEEGMDLVETCAAYLDGVGRQDSKTLSRAAALAYAEQSMRLTTRLMQVASWLLVQRAVKEGDMPSQAACEARYRLGPDAAQPPEAVLNETLPQGLAELLDRSERLYERVRHLDQRMYLEAQTQEAAPNPVQSHYDRLQNVFGGL